MCNITAFPTSLKKSQHMYNPDEDNPGEELQLFLKTIVPVKIGDRSYIGEIDRILNADEEFTMIVYNSCINYMVRRMIRTAQWLYRTEQAREGNEVRYQRSLRDWLGELNLSKSALSRIETLLMESVIVANRSLSSSRRENFVNDQRKSGNTKCYMCGIELDFNSRDQHSSAEVEHLWPHSLGGQNNSKNLRLACHKCNGLKKSMIDSSDMHYEQFTIQTDEQDEDFAKDLGPYNKLLSMASQKYTCSRCGEPISRVGPLKLARLNRGDSWHYLNVLPYCERDHPKRSE